MMTASRLLVSPPGLHFLLLLLTSSIITDTVLAQRSHRQSRIEEVGDPVQVSEHRRRYRTTGEIEFALLDPSVDPDGVDEDDFELVLSDGSTLLFEGLDMHDNEQEPGFRYWTKENEDMSSILLVFTDSQFGSKGVRGVIQNATSGITYEFSGDVVDGTILTDFDIDEVEQYDEEYDPLDWNQLMAERDHLDEQLPGAPLVFIDGVDDPPDPADSGRALMQLRGTDDDYARRLQKDDSGSVLDVLVVITRLAMCAIARAGSGCSSTAAHMTKVESHMNTAVANTNEAYRESGINTRMRMVHFYVDNSINELSGSWGNVLSKFASNASVRSKRNQFGADFAALIINKGQYCGVGLKPNSQSEIRESMGYSLTQWDCATGYLSFAHEVAHNMGCNHDRRNAPSGAPGDYNFGYADPGGRFRSVMSYSCGGSCTRLRRFSGDQSWTDNGQRVGNSNRENNAKWIRQNLSRYAKFRDMVVPLSGGGPSPTPFPTPSPTPSPTPQGPPTNKRTLVANNKGGRSGGDGNMFDLKAKTDLQITNFGVHTDTESFSRLEIYKRKQTGSFVGSQFDPTKWRLIGAAEFNALGSGIITKLKEGTFPPVPIRKGETQAFYISFRKETSNNMYSTGTRVGQLHESDDSLEFFEGIAIHYPFGGNNQDTWSPRVWNGDIDYELGTFTPAPLETPSPSDSPTLPPTAGPTLATPSPTSPRSVLTPSPTAATPAPQVPATPAPQVPATPAPTGPIGTPSPAAPTKNPQVRTETTYKGGNGQAGNMFVLHSTATNPVVIETFDIHTHSEETEEVVIYTMEGSFELKPGSDKDESMWSRIGQSEKVEGAGSPNPTKFPPDDMFSPVTIYPGQNQSFYITMTDTKIRYTTGSAHRELNQEIPVKLVASVGKSYFFGATFSPRIFNGAYYWREASGGGPAATPAPTNGGAGPIPRFHTTTYKNGNGSFGNMFDIKAKNDITLTNLHIHVSTTNKVDVEIYKLKAPNVSFKDFTKAPDDWERIAEVKDVEGQGTGNPTMLPEGAIDVPVSIPAGEVQAFYVAIVRGGRIRYTNGDSQSSVEYPMYNDSEDLEVYEGVGVGGPKFGPIFTPRVFNGIFEYFLTKELSSSSDGGGSVSMETTATLDEGKSLVEVMEDASFSYPPGEKAEGWPCTSNEECASNHCSAAKAIIVTEATLMNEYVDGASPPPPPEDDYDAGSRARQRRHLEGQRWCLNEHGAHHEDGMN